MYTTPKLHSHGEQVEQGRKRDMRNEMTTAVQMVGTTVGLGWYVSTIPQHKLISRTDDFPFIKHQSSFQQDIKFCLHENFTHIST